MNFKMWLEERQKGRPLSEADPRYAHRNAQVAIYRACLATDAGFKSMDYVTLSYKFAIDHAKHVQAIEEEPAHVLRARVPATMVFEAYNPGEFFYDGPNVVGQPTYRTK